MIIKNEAFNDYIVTINSIDYQLKKSTSINVDIDKGTEILVKCTSKDSVHIDIFDLLLGVFFGDSTITLLYASYRFTVNDDYETITLKENKWNPRQQISIKACYTDVAVSNESYFIPNINRTKKKHFRLHLFVTSLFPVALVLILLCFLFDATYLFLLFLAFWFLIFGLPSFKEIKRFKKVTEPSLVNEKLCAYACERRNKGDNYDEDISKTGKFIGKIMDKMFKFDEDK